MMSVGTDWREARAFEKRANRKSVGETRRCAGWDHGANRASNDAAVSIVPPKIPYGGFSPVRLQGRYFRRGLPVDYEFFAARSLPPSFVHPAACNVVSSI